MLSGEVAKWNEGKWSILPHCYRQASFKFLVQGNPSEKEYHKHNHEKHESEFTTEGSVSQEEFDIPKWVKNHGQEPESSGILKCKIKNITGHTSPQGLDDYDSGDKPEQQIISWAIDNTGPVSSRSTLSQLYSANCTASLCAPSHVYNFSHSSVTLNITRNDAVQKSTSDARQGYKRIFITESDSEWSESILNALNLFEKALTLYF